jgi:hypothetical protein
LAPAAVGILQRPFGQANAAEQALEPQLGLKTVAGRAKLALDEGGRVADVFEEEAALEGTDLVPLPWGRTSEHQVAQQMQQLGQRVDPLLDWRMKKIVLE